MTNKIFSEKIATLRKSKNMTQQELAEKLGVTNKAVSRWETGEGYPEVTLLASLADILGVTVDHLLSSKKYESKEMRDQGNQNVSKEKLVWVDFFSFAMPLLSLLLFVLLLCIPMLGRGIVFILFLLFWGLSLYFRKSYYWNLKKSYEEESKITVWCNWYKAISVVTLFPIISVVQDLVLGWLYQHNGMEILDALVFYSETEGWPKERLYYEIFVWGMALFVTFLVYKVGMYIVTKNGRDVNQPIRVLLWLRDSMHVWKNTKRMKLLLFDFISVLLFLFFLYWNLDLQRFGFIKEGSILFGDQLWLSITILTVIVCIYAVISFYFFGVLESPIPRLYILRNNIVVILLMIGFYVSGERVCVVSNTGRIVDPNAVMNWDAVSSVTQIHKGIFALFLFVIVIVVVIFNWQARKQTGK